MRCFRCARACHCLPRGQAVYADFFGSGFSDGLRRYGPVASAGIEHEGGAVFESEFDRLAGGGALVEQVETWLHVHCTSTRPGDTPRFSAGKGRRKKTADASGGLGCADSLEHAIDFDPSHS